MKQKTRIYPRHGSSEVQENAGTISPILDRDIIDMINVRRRFNRCDTLCRGNPITDAGKRTQLVKMLSVVMIPVLVITGMTGNNFASSIGNYISSASVRDVLYFSIELGALLRIIQFERDMSALYVSNIKPETKDFLLQRYPDTDLAIQNLSYWPQGENLIPEMETREKFLSYLNKHRYQLDVFDQSVEGELNFYSGSIDVLLKWLYDSVSETGTGSIWKDVVAYQEIIVASELFGRERALGVSFYATGGFETREEYLLFVEKQNRANVTFESARFYSKIAFDLYNVELAKNPNVSESIEDFRNRIKSNNYSKESASIAEAEMWFGNMTIYQGVLTRTQKALALTIDDNLVKASQEGLESVITICVIFGFILIVCPLLVFAVYTLTSDIQKYSILIADRTHKLKKEKKRTELLLYKMLPKSVAEQLRQDKNVDPEKYYDSTIFFSSIVDFENISSHSSPLQVVKTLTDLYKDFDHRIAMYDVYKVDTITDAYMVVSGIPKRNGIRHASQIGTMALDILDHIQNWVVPHLPGVKLEIRIGIHSGPVIAGIFEIKMPRYCLFGDTVNVALKMEKMGIVNKIHISQTTRDYLLATDGYDMEERDDDVVKKDKEVSDIFKGILRTYWLNNSDDFMPAKKICEIQTTKQKKHNV
ncbi:uncharacterized protein LOC127719800 isoform X1 [Mytilus californianus]|uniref:uncharacterized protein LOC127719800 isoform X1 n=1 Tax=Mytilus californianus TaxID=6549 RepID=UPI002246C4E7|nr:uncharacterized protein LOC127719800 isoform X1 [Mytilus californianus]XP_052082037.1 uncharacterized protein LOC127719800 isoform X1 [Mytilus californianus]